jgi:predicted DNA-binding transcriptional regulator YafY
MKRYLLLSIMLELLKKDRVKASELASKFEISTRTVYRYLNDLEIAGVPTVTYVGKKRRHRYRQTLQVVYHLFYTSRKGIYHQQHNHYELWPQQRNCQQHYK